MTIRSDMGALKQYKDLYRAHEDLLCKGCGEPLNSARRKAYADLCEMTLPAMGSENYEKTDLDEILAPDYGLNIARVPLEVNPAETFRCDVPNLSSNLFMLLNDSYCETDRSRNNLPEGITVGSLREISETDPGLVEKYYGKLADRSNPLVNLNTMLVQDGFLLHVAKGTRLQRPLQLVDIFQYARPLMSARRLLIVLEDDTEAKLLLCDHTQNRDNDFLNLQTIEIFVGHNATFDLYDLEESSERTHRLSSLYMRQEAGSNVMISGITLFNGFTRNEFRCTFAGENAELHLCGMGIEDRNRLLDNYTRIDHATGSCHSDELFKYVVDDTATAAFSGLIYVAPGAVKTTAYQSNRNIVGSDEAVMYSKPQLEIYNDDVKCSHGCATGQLDETQMFYMRTRGVPEDEAELLLKQAFMADVIESVRIPVLKDRLRQLVERRFAGEESSCANCHRDCGIIIDQE